ncbi:hypothetical protein [Pseudooceanicola sp. 200-1SW]|uniref:hypothetical protein n=1 Tax=Pseudooceanicola sp. 200-1SW TaxID=3425949 RepID=UPI003D7F7BB3
MSAKLGATQRGRGETSDQAPTGGGGLTDERLEALLGSDAKEAIGTLEGDFAAGKMPDIAAVQFPGPIAERFFWSNDDVIGIQGPVGSGKTTTLMKSRARRAVEMPRSRIDGVRRYKVLFIRETYRQLWSTTIPSYLETFPKDLGTWSGGRGDPVTHVIQFEDDFGPIEFTAEFMAFGDDIVASMRGVQTTDIVLNELDTMPVEILTVGIGRIDRYPGRQHFEGLPPELRSYGQIVGDMNAPDEDSWGFTVFHDEEERKRMADLLSAELPAGAKRITIEFCNQPGYGEPGCENLQNLSPSYYPRQIASMQLAGRGDMVDRLVRNKIVYLRVGEPVFKREFNPRVHVSDIPLALIPGLPLRIGLDQGFKGAAVIAQMTGFYRWRILGELHFPSERLLARTFGERLTEAIEDRWPGALVEAAWGDMAGEHGASQAADENATWNLMVSQAAGFPIRPQRLGTNRIQPRLEAVRAALEAPIDAGEPGLLIDPSCKFLRRGFQARYVWTDEVDRNGDKRKVPDKRLTEANVMDALQYLLLSEHTADGAAPYTKRVPDARRSGRPGHPGRPPRSGQRGGLKTGWNVLNPYER